MITEAVPPCNMQVEAGNEYNCFMERRYERRSYQDFERFVNGERTFSKSYV